MAHYLQIIPYVKRIARALYYMGDDDPIFIFSHADADGIASASILALLLKMLDKPFVIRFLRQLRKDILENIAEEVWPYNIIFSDFGSGQLREISRTLRRAARVIIIDHHVIGKKPNFIPFKLYHLNLRLFGVNGGEEASSSSTAYLLARTFLKVFPELKILVKPAIIGAIGDNQDVGEKRSLIGINKLIAEEGKKFGIIREKIDLIIPGKSTKPVFQALADIYTPIIPGITGSPEATYKLLVSLGILKDEITYQMITWDDLDEEKKQKIFEIIAQRLMASGGMSLEKINQLLLGTIYEFTDEKMTIKKDAREFSILLNATARTNKAAVGLATLLGDSNAEKEAYMILKRYHYELSNALREAFNLLKKEEKIGIIDGRGKIKEEYVSVIASIIARSSPDVKLIIAFADSDLNYVKVSLRKTIQSDIKSVEEIITKAINGIKGASGGGHENAGGAFIPADKIELFIERVKRLVR